MSPNSEPFSKDPAATRHRAQFTMGCMTEFVRTLIATVRPQSLMEWYTLQWSIRIHFLSDQLGKKLFSIKYESFMENRSETLSKLFDYLEVDKRGLDIALKSLEFDSQEGTFLSKKARQNNSDWIRTEETVARCNRILKAFNLPDFDSDFVYEDWAQ